MNEEMRHAPNLMQRRFAVMASTVARLSGHPLTFLVSCCIVLVWVIASLAFHLADTWQTLIGTSLTMGTFLMVFLIQNTQTRNSAAVQAKLDELIRALGPANNKFIGLEHHTVERAHELREEAVDEIRVISEATG